ncbi:MAG: tetratricopeptide repeat protein [Candidatus Thiocaldithrix dubininis]|jgi:tetratricopeptide (TPR) repeat protein|uniref:Tetratricopeptide repeat protein n=1 Tax=Candidatus Thiocaldithrix dubininis TaxID=3080823 RepID=A0AA95H5P0_9GAMM|nr:MAG: tetratricopeptide repeat protein [Candidatus Thiocaldithrix dubininis]
MKATTKVLVPVSLGLSLALSACSPNPNTFNSAVYGSVAPPVAIVPRYDPPLENRYVPRYIPRTEGYLQARPYSSASTYDVPASTAGRVQTLPLTIERPPRVERLEPTKESPKITPSSAPTESNTQSDNETVPNIDEPKAPRKPPRQYQTSAAVQALLKQADSDVAQGRVDGAIATVERALRIEEDNPAVWLKLASLYERQGNRQQSRNMADKAKYYQELLN